MTRADTKDETIPRDDPNVAMAETEVGREALALTDHDSEDSFPALEGETLPDGAFANLGRELDSLPPADPRAMPPNETENNRTLVYQSPASIGLPESLAQSTASTNPLGGDRRKLPLAPAKPTNDTSYEGNESAISTSPAIAAAPVVNFNSKPSK